MMLRDFTLMTMPCLGYDTCGENRPVLPGRCTDSISMDLPLFWPSSFLLDHGPVYFNHGTPPEGWGIFFYYGSMFPKVLPDIFGVGE